MPTRIRITIRDVTVDGELFDTPCARAICQELPVETVYDEWGDEFYSEVPVKMPLDDTATINVKCGDIGYWPQGKALAIFFGPTPLSTGPDPVPAGKINLVGRIIGDAAILRKAKGGDEMLVEKV